MCIYFVCIWSPNIFGRELFNAFSGLSREFAKHYVNSISERPIATRDNLMGFANQLQNNCSEWMALLQCPRQPLCTYWFRNVFVILLLFDTAAENVHDQVHVYLAVMCAKHKYRFVLPHMETLVRRNENIVSMGPCKKIVSKLDLHN